MAQVSRQLSAAEDDGQARSAQETALTRPWAALNVVGKEATLADVTQVISQADKTVCPWFEACALLGYPDDPVFKCRC